MITSPGVSGFIDRYLVFKLSAQLFEFFSTNPIDLKIIFSQNYFY